jgi:hypothetical protein
VWRAFCRFGAAYLSEGASFEIDSASCHGPRHQVIDAMGDRSEPGLARLGVFFPQTGRAGIWRGHFLLGALGGVGARTGVSMA